MSKKTFSDHVKDMESRTSRVAAYVIIDPNDPGKYRRVVIMYPADGAGRLRVVAWLPGEDEGGYPNRVVGSATGYGYDKATAALGGGKFRSLKTGKDEVLADQGWDWAHQLREHGYIVAQAV